MKRDEIMVVGIMMIFLLMILSFAFAYKDTPSELAKSITQGIECMKYKKNCKRANRP